MDLVTQTAILPLLFGCLGIFSLFRVLQRIRSRTYLRNAVVVVTGATSGLGRGKSVIPGLESAGFLGITGRAEGPVVHGPVGK